MTGLLIWALKCILLLACSCHAFYIPGWSIKSYRDGDRVPLYVNKVTSDSTQLPFAYSELPFVCPTAEKKTQGLNLGEVLRGDRISESNYQLKMNQGVKCADLCEVQVDQAGMSRAYDLIQNNYLAEWIVDNLPGATAFISLDRTKRYYAAGFPLGSIDQNSGKVLLNNHITILIRYRPDNRNPDRNIIVGFEVYPKSISNDSPKCATKADVLEPMIIDPEKADGEVVEPQTVRYTYSVFWREDTTVEWANRWDMYFSHSEESNQIHWLAIVNSTVIAAFLSIVVGVILVRTLSRDIELYNRQEEQAAATGNSDEPDKNDGLENTSGWKLVHGDVFRLPAKWGLLASLVGSGSQFFVMVIAVVGFACIGILNPSYRGGLLSFALFIFAFAGVFAGFVTTRLNKDNGIDSWFATAILTATIVPACILVVVLVLNMVLWANASSSALPFGTIVALFCIWLLISCPLVFIGCHLSSRLLRASQPPNRVAAIARQIPPQRYNTSVVATMVGGLLPFAVIFAELTFIMKSMWQEKTGYYYMYGFFSLVGGLLILTVMEMSVVMTYFQLNSEDYHWWWRSFFVGTGSAWWVFIYSVYYYITTLKIGGFSSSLVFFGYSMIGCLVYGLVTGAIGFLASYVFVRKIYGAIKAE